MKKAYRNDPVFADAKIIYSVYNNELSHSFDNRFLNIAAINDLEVDDLDVFKEGDAINLDLGAIKYSDGIISGSESNNEIVTKYGEQNNLPFQVSPLDIDELAQASVQFYKTILE